jgi:hypothetical protein
MTTKRSEETLLSYVYNGKPRINFEDKLTDIALGMCPTSVYQSAEDILGLWFGPSDLRDYLLELEQEIIR